MRRNAFIDIHKKRLVLLKQLIVLMA